MYLGEVHIFPRGNKAGSSDISLVSFFTEDVHFLFSSVSVVRPLSVNCLVY